MSVRHPFYSYSSRIFAYILISTHLLTCPFVLLFLLVAIFVVAAASFCISVFFRCIVRCCNPNFLSSFLLGEQQRRSHYCVHFFNALSFYPCDLYSGGWRKFNCSLLWALGNWLIIQTSQSLWEVGRNWLIYWHRLSNHSRLLKLVFICQWNWVDSRYLSIRLTVHNLFQLLIPPVNNRFHR